MFNLITYRDNTYFHSLTRPGTLSIVPCFVLDAYRTLDANITHKSLQPYPHFPYVSDLFGASIHYSIPKFTLFINKVNYSRFYNRNNQKKFFSLLFCVMIFNHL
jgi:hypothetical protein